VFGVFSTTSPAGCPRPAAAGSRCRRTRKPDRGRSRSRAGLVVASAIRGLISLAFCLEIAGDGRCPKGAIYPIAPLCWTRCPEGIFFCGLRFTRKAPKKQFVSLLKARSRGLSTSERTPSNLGRVGVQLPEIQMDQIKGRKGSVDNGCPVLYLSLATMSQVFQSHPELLRVSGSHKRRMLHF